MGPGYVPNSIAARVNRVDKCGQSVDQTRAAHCGGSRGGAAAALACGMLPLADGSDIGGSLRNPAAFCNVVGFRPSLGRLPAWPNAMAWQSRLGVEDPMARNVADCALLLSVLAGPDERDPLSLQDAPARFREDLQHDFCGARIGWTPDLGILLVEREVADICAGALPVWESLAIHVEAACPDLAGAMDTFKTLRAAFNMTAEKHSTALYARFERARPQSSPAFAQLEQLSI